MNELAQAYFVGLANGILISAAIVLFICRLRLNSIGNEITRLESK